MRGQEEVINSASNARRSPPMHPTFDGLAINEVSLLRSGGKRRNCAFSVDGARGCQSWCARRAGGDACGSTRHIKTIPRMGRSTDWVRRLRLTAIGCIPTETLARVPYYRKVRRVRFDVLQPGKAVGDGRGGFSVCAKLWCSVEIEKRAEHFHRIRLIRPTG